MDYIKDLENLQVDTQTYLIGKHLVKQGSITTMESFAEYGCTRLSARIYDLRDRGWDIRTTRMSAKNKYGHKISYAMYTLQEEENEIEEQIQSNH